MNRNLGVSNLQGGTGIGGNGSNLLRTTRFNDLPDEFKRQLESLDAMIQNQCRLADTIKSTELGKEINEGSSQLRQVKAELNGTSSLINESSIMLENLQKTLDQDISDILKIGTNLESLNNNPTKSNQEMNNLLKFQLDFFIKQTLKLNERIKVYEQTLEFVECQLKGLNDRPNPASIVPAIKAQYSTFMVLADRVAKLDSRLRFIEDGFIEIWKLQTGSVKNPFLEIDLQNQNQNQNQKLLN
ncbi:hypothetical protein DFH28DRAFT_26201 [Melampsora americana]|nr:hypothetical protein DFH28DRAFT_26201 [Melampsora americana]